MSNTAKTIELPEPLQELAEERVRTGEGADVVRDALEEKKRAVCAKLSMRASQSSTPATVSSSRPTSSWPRSTPTSALLRSALDPMARVIRSPRAKHDIVGVLEYTKERWGTAQAREHGELIRQALVAIAHDPKRGKFRDDVRSGVFAYHIKQQGRPARHIIFHRTGPSGAVEIVRFLHDSMDFDQHLPYPASLRVPSVPDPLTSPS